MNVLMVWGVVTDRCLLRGGEDLSMEDAVWFKSEGSWEEDEAVREGVAGGKVTVFVDVDDDGRRACLLNERLRI
jgi:hypothetical protein